MRFLVQNVKWNYLWCINVYNDIIFPSGNHANIFESIPDEPHSTSTMSVSQITYAVIYIKWGYMCPLLCWIYNFSRRIFERVFGRNIVNIRNSCFFSDFEWIGARNKQIPENRFLKNRVKCYAFDCLENVKFKNKNFYDMQTPIFTLKRIFHAKSSNTMPLLLFSLEYKFREIIDP